MVRASRNLSNLRRAAAQADPGYRDAPAEGSPGDPLRPWFDAYDLRRAAEAAAAGAGLDGLYRADAPGQPLDGVYAGVGDAVRAIWAGDRRLRKSERVLNAMSERVPSAGGFLVGEDLRSDLVLASLEHAIIRPRALTVPMGTLRTGLPAVDDTTHSGGTVAGGFAGWWTEETATLVEDDAAYQRIFLEAKKLIAYGTAPNELMDDAAAFDAYLHRVVPRAMAWFEDQAFIAGSGVGEPQGVINAPCRVPVTRASAGKVEFADVVAMLPRMLPASLTRCVWLCSPDVLGQLLQLYLNTGGASAATTIVPTPPPGWLAFRGGQWELLGLPCFPTEHVSALGTAGDLVLFDPGMYLIGDRALLTVDVSEHHKFGMDVSAVKIRERVDGRMWLQSPLTPENGSQTVSAVVTLN